MSLAVLHPNANTRSVDNFAQSTRVSRIQNPVSWHSTTNHLQRFPWWLILILIHTFIRSWRRGRGKRKTRMKKNYDVCCDWNLSTKSHLNSISTSTTYSFYFLFLSGCQLTPFGTASRGVRFWAHLNRKLSFDQPPKGITYLFSSVVHIPKAHISCRAIQMRLLNSLTIFRNRSI